MPAAGWLLLAAWACLLGGGGGQQLVVTRGTAGTTNLVQGAPLAARSMVGSTNMRVSLTVGWELAGNEDARRVQINAVTQGMPQADWLTVNQNHGQNQLGPSETRQVSLTFRASAGEGEHAATLKFRYRFQGTATSEYAWAGWQDSTVTVQFTVAAPSYSLLSIPQEAVADVVAGTTTTRTFFLYNVLGQRLAWRCTAEAPEWLAAAGDCFGVIAVQQDAQLSLTITTPELVPERTTLLHTGTLESWPSVEGAGTDPVSPATTPPDGVATYELDVQIRITVLPDEMDAAQSDFVWETPVEAGDPMAVDVMPSDQYGNDISTAGLSFTMTLSTTGGATEREEISRFDPDEARYRIEVAEMPVQGDYEMAVTFSGEDGQDVAIQKDGADSAAVAVDAKTCADGSLSAIGICLDCG